MTSALLTHSLTHSLTAFHEKKFVRVRNFFQIGQRMRFGYLKI